MALPVVLDNVSKRNANQENPGGSAFNSSVLCLKKRSTKTSLLQQSCIARRPSSREKLAVSLSTRFDLSSLIARFLTEQVLLPCLLTEQCSVPSQL